MLIKRTILLLLLVLFVALLALHRSHKAFHGINIQPLGATTDSLLKVSSTDRAVFQQTSFQANLNGSFSTNHLENDRDPNSRWTNPAKPVDVVFPRSFSEPMAIKSSGAVVQCLPRNGNPDSQPELMDDKTLIYRNAFPGCDVRYRSSIYKTEEFIVVKDSSALDEIGKASWSWELQTQYEGTELTPRLTPLHTIVLVDDHSVPRLRIDAPFGTDATGSAILADKHIKFTVDGSQLTMLFDSSGLKLPVEIDPSWSSTGTMASRMKHIPQH